MSVSTADLWDERGEQLQSCSVQLRHYGGRTEFSGVISTGRCHRDNALGKAALAEPGEGRVLVVDGEGSLESALMGDLIAASAVAQNWSGVVIHGAVRDVVALRDLPLGTLALGSNPRKSAKDGAGARDVPVAFGGVEFVPGQTLWADEDGVVATYREHGHALARGIAATALMAEMYGKREGCSRGRGAERSCRVPRKRSGSPASNGSRAI